MNNSSHSALLPIAIALATTAFTTSFTHYLLQRPWCVQINADQSQQIVYGYVGCDSLNVVTHLRQPDLTLGLLHSESQLSPNVNNRD